jgi:cystathionine gamma-synthase
MTEGRAQTAIRKDLASMSNSKDPRTIAASNGIASDTAFGAVTPPIYLTSTFAFEGFEREGAYAYTRAGNPTRDLLAKTLAKLEGGAGAVVTAKGMAAIDLVLDQLGPDDLVIAPHVCYGATCRLLAARAARAQFSVAFVDQSDEVAVAIALEGAPSLMLIENPSNPLVRVVDIRILAEWAKREGAKVIVDDTFLSPVLQRPIELGADYAVHSTTKHLNGHSDVVRGAVIAADAAVAESLAAWANIIGVTGAPFDAYLTLRGLRTLFPRIGRQQQSAAAVAAFLYQHPAVKAVHYLGRPTHPGHPIVRAHQSGFGAMLSFELAGGVDDVRAFVGALKLFTLAQTLGGVESLIAHPATMTHADMGAEARAVAGISDSLLRLSIGTTSEPDLLADVDQGLNAILQRRPVSTRSSALPVH